MSDKKVKLSKAQKDFKFKHPTTIHADDADRINAINKSLAIAVKELTDRYLQDGHKSTNDALKKINKLLSKSSTT